MQAQSTNGVKVWMTKAATVLISETLTGWGTATTDVEMTNATGVSEGDYLEFTSGTLTGKIYPVTGKSSNTVTLAGFDHTGLVAQTSATLIPKAGMVQLCLAGFTINSNSGATISVGTFCNPSASIPSVVQEAGTLELTGFIDSTATDYAEILKASTDGKPRFLTVDLPNNNGSLTTMGIVGRVSYDIPLDGALGCSAVLVMNTPLAHHFS